MSVFLSYSRTDSDFADLLYNLLTTKGYTVWMDRRSIGGGSRWDREVEEAINNSSHMVIVLSADGARSENVADEWSYALEKDKKLIPLHYGCDAIPMRLRRLQWIDFEKELFATAFKKLIDTLGEPDHRPTDPIALAKREGLIFVQMEYPFELEPTRIAFVYSDYPTVQSLLGKIWFTLMWNVVERYTYGEKWLVRDKLTKQTFVPAPTIDTGKLLLHEVGIEPGAHLEIVLLDSKGT